MALIVIGIVSTVKCRTYEVEVTFCDKRPTARYTIEICGAGDTAPNSRGISTYKQAVPTWQGFLNVCDVKTIKEVK